MSTTKEYLLDIADLVTLPDIYLAIKEAIEDPGVDMEEIATIIAHDPALSSRVLKVANSPLYGQIAEIDTIKKATALLGTKTLHDLVLAISVAQTFRSLVGVDYDVASFWKSSINRAAIAKACARELNIMKPDNLFIIGLLSDIGHMVMSIRAPKLMRGVLLQHKKTNYALYLLERSAFGFDYGELGADLLENWSIPHSIVTAIRHQNSPEIALEFQQETAIIYCAGRMHPDETEFPNKIDTETLRQVGIEQLDCDRVRTEASQHIEEALSLFPIKQLKHAV